MGRDPIWVVIQFGSCSFSFRFWRLSLHQAWDDLNLNRWQLNCVAWLEATNRFFFGSDLRPCVLVDFRMEAMCFRVLFSDHGGLLEAAHESKLMHVNTTVQMAWFHDIFLFWSVVMFTTWAKHFSPGYEGELRSMSCEEGKLAGHGIPKSWMKFAGRNLPFLLDTQQICFWSSDMRKGSWS